MPDNYRHVREIQQPSTERTRHPRRESANLRPLPASFGGSGINPSHELSEDFLADGDEFRSAISTRDLLPSTSLEGRGAIRDDDFTKFLMLGVCWPRQSRSFMAILAGSAARKTHSPSNFAPIMRDPTMCGYSMVLRRLSSLAFNWFQYGRS